MEQEQRNSNVIQKGETSNGVTRLGEAPSRSRKGMTVIVKTIASWVKVLIFLFGINIVLFGHLTPGGGFAGGVILASSYVLLMLAFGREFAEKNLSLPLASRLDCLGALMFALVAILGLAFGGSFFLNFLYQKYLPGQALHLVSAGTIPLSNIAIGLKVGASLFLIVLILSISCKGKECRFE